MFWNQPVVGIDDVPKEPEEEIPKLSEYLKNINIDDFIDLDFEPYSVSNLDPETILGTESDINELIGDTVIRNNQSLSQVEKRIIALNDQIEFLKGFFFDQTVRRSKIKENRFYIPDSVYLTEVETGNGEPTSRASSTRQKIRKSGFSAHSDKKTFENFEYRHFDNNELTEFPGYLEAAQLLNSLTAKMKFKPSFLKYWNAIVRSEASCAILLDSFWWFYLRRFRPDADSNNDSYKYFCRLSESFAALLFSIDVSIRDRFFEYYAEFLSQAIYLAFFKSFPDSRLYFNDEFKEELSNTVYEWVLGIRPIKDSYLKWVINEETSSVSNQDFKVSSTNRILQKIENLEMMLNELGDEMSKVTPPETKEVKFRDDVVIYERPKSLKSRNDKKLSDIEKSLDEFYSKNKQSHVVGEGAVIEKLGFNPKGQSVLISQYKKMFNLQESGAASAFKITRSEISKNPPQTAPTYRDFIYETLERSKSAGDEFKKKINSNREEFDRIEAERKKAEDEYRRIRRSGRSTERKRSPKK